MKILGTTKIKEVLAHDEEKMIGTLMWLAPEFERLQYPKLRRAMAGRVSVSQAARIARIPLTEILYALNLAIGADEAELSAELRLSERADFEYSDTNPPIKPKEIATVKDDAQNVVFVDLMKHADDRRDPMPAIAKGLVSLKGQATSCSFGTRLIRYRCGMCSQDAVLKAGLRNEDRETGSSTFFARRFARRSPHIRPFRNPFTREHLRRQLKVAQA